MAMEQQQLLNNPKCSFSFLNASSDDEPLPNLISSSSSSSWNMSPSSRNSSPQHHSSIPTKHPIHNNIQICTSYIKSPDVTTTTRTPYTRHGNTSTPSSTTTTSTPPQQLKTIMMPFSTISTTNFGTMNATEDTVDWIVGDSSYDKTNYICSSTKIISKPMNSSSTRWKSMGGNCQVFADACADMTVRNTTSDTSSTTTNTTTANKRSKSKPLSRAKSESSALVVETSSAINDAARVCGWTDVQQLCQLNPLDAAYRDIDGWTALHHACNRRPPVDVIQALTDACPEAVHWQDKTKGMTPLHYACRFKASKEVVQLLIDASLKSSTKTICSAPCKRGRTPLWYALRYDAPDGIMDLLLLQYPLGGILVDHLDESPLRYIWDRTISKLGKKGFAKVNQVIADAASSSDAVISSLAQSRDKDVKDLYNAYIKAIKMVRAAYHSHEHILLQVNDDSDEMYPNILHALARVGACHIHPSLWDISTSIFSNQASLRDSRGNLPIHYAVSPCTVCFHLAEELHTHSRSSSWEDTNPTSIPVVASSTSMLPSATTAASVLSAKTMALSLLKLYPEAAFLPDSTGRLPLHSALDSNNRRPSSQSCSRERFGWKCDPNDDDTVQHECGVIGRLVQCHPEALYKMDSLTGLYPFMMAAAYNYYTPHNNEIDLFAIELAFDLLLESPGLVRTTDSSTFN